MATIISEFRQWLLQIEPSVYCQSKWLAGDEMNVYVRKCTRIIDGFPRSSVDIASVTVHQQGQGHFTRFIQEVLRLNPYDIVYIENVLTLRFAEYFRKRGYIEIKGSYPPCFYAHTPHEPSTKEVFNG